jgi:hypothetical protein
MARSNNRDARESHHTVSAGILDALGRGFLIATAGVVAGALFGTANLAALSLWTIAVAAASGVGCMVGSALVRNAGCAPVEPKDGESTRAAQVRAALMQTPVVDAGENATPEERWARRMAMNGREGQRSGRSV